MLNPDQAQKIILERAKPLPPVSKKLSGLLGHVLARDVASTIDHPPFDNSAMDGYAVIAADTADASKDCPRKLEVLETIQAGSCPSFKVRKGTAVKIMTGAPIPDGADAVVKVEDTAFEDGRVSIFAGASPKDHVRPAAEDIARGRVILSSGEQLTPARIGLAAAAGHARLDVYPRPKVGILITGEELVEPGKNLDPGKIYNSNGSTLYSQVLEAGGIPVNYGVAGDEIGLLTDAVGKALDECDIVVTSGGVSMGDYDLVEDAAVNAGVSVDFSKIAQRPGKPMVGGVTGGKLFFGLPGNPVSVMVCFEVYVRPAIRRILGHRDLFRATYPGFFEKPFSKKKGLTYWSRVTCKIEDGVCFLNPAGPQGSGLLTSMAYGDGLAELPAEYELIEPGQAVTVHLFGELL